MLTVLAAVLISAFVVLLIMIGGVWWRQERIAYQPPAECPESPSAVRRIDYAARDGQALFAFILEPEAPPAGILLAFHGNADLAVWQIPWARELTRRTGWCVMLAEYRGYGGLGGAPSYDALREDARAAWNVAQGIGLQWDIQPPPIALFGHSLGSAIVAELAAEFDHPDCETNQSHTAHSRPNAVLLQSPFTSARDMVRIVSTRPVRLVWKIISRVHYDTRARLSEISAPVSIAHGRRDWLVPVAMGRELFAHARVPGRLLVVEHAGHNDVAEFGGEFYWQWVCNALTERPTTCLEAGSTRRTEMSD